MLTDVFTGHTISLAHLRAVSPTMVEHRAVSPYLAQRVLYAELHLSGSVTIRHNVFVQEVPALPDERADAVWQDKIDKLESQLIDLTDEWNRYLKASVRHPFSKRQYPPGMVSGGIPTS